ncbi:MAG TPA: acyl-CoA thioesterase [Ktedonobacteraceae bacterium]
MDTSEAQYPELPDVDLTQGRSIEYSRSTTSRLMGPVDGNGQGNVHGGVIMRMVDDAAAIVAMKHSRRPVVTARVDRFDFVAPAYIGNVVHVHCTMTYVGRTSMEVGVEVMAEDLLTGEVRNIANSHVIYVALDVQRKPTPVPPLVPANAEEAEHIERARMRRERMRQIEEELAKS